MNTQTYPTDLTDRHWDYIKDLIPAAKLGGRPRSLDMRRYCQLNPQTKKWVCRPREICIIEEVSLAFWSTRSPSLLPLSCSKPQTVPAWRHGSVVPGGDGGADKSARDEAPARQATVGHGPLI